jgi:beta-barrel assembly-enhancing protease
MAFKTVALLISLLLVLPDGQILIVAEMIKKSYLDLFELNEIRKFSSAEIDNVTTQLKKDQRTEENRLKKEEDRIKKETAAARQRLNGLNKEASKDNASAAAARRQLHCEVLRLEDELRKTKLQREKGLPIAYQNKLAKLDLIQKWPTLRQEIERNIKEGRARERRFGDIDDIGVRDLDIENIAEKQQSDIKTGKDAIDEMKRQGLFPKELEDKETIEYIRALAEEVARNSDLRIPLKVTLLDSMEINAFALPGGFLFVNSGLVNKAESESELVGVIAHEIAHAAARHGARLMKRAQIANIFFQGAQVAAIIFTGGAASIGSYYALQYGFYGLGMVLELTLLGVSRDYESEADQLGAQYAWQAGYDPKGFITFFDKMANEEGYVRSASFFRTHPPFLERIISTFSEITYLPSRDESRMDSSAFHEAKERMSKLTRKREAEEKNRPTLKGKDETGAADCADYTD